MSDLWHVTKLRYRRLGGGYKREEVHYVLRELEDRIRRLEARLEQERANAAELAARVEAADAELASFRERERELDAALETSRRRAAELAETAAAEARAVLAEAAERAVEIRSEAHLRVDEATRRLDELLQLKQNMVDSMRAVVEDVHVVVDRIERNEPVLPRAEEAGAADAGRAAVGPPAPPPVDRGAEIVFERAVEVEAWSFGDFAALSAFERALARLPRVSDVYVRRFADGHATIEVTLSEPSSLLADMRRELPFRFEVGHADATSLQLSVSTPSLAEAG